MWKFQNQSSRAFLKLKFTQLHSLTYYTKLKFSLFSNFVNWALNKQKMIFLLDVIYIWKELTWTVKLDQKQQRRD